MNPAGLTKRRNRFCDFGLNSEHIAHCCADARRWYNKTRLRITPHRERSISFENNNHTNKPDGQAPDTKKRSGIIWTLLYILVGAVFLTGVYSDTARVCAVPRAVCSAATPAPTATVAPTLPPEVTPAPTPSPTRMSRRFPCASISRIMTAGGYLPVGVTENNEMATLDSAQDAAWFQFRPSPGEEGNAIINGHVRWKAKRHVLHTQGNVGGRGGRHRIRRRRLQNFTVDTLNTYLLDEVPPSVMDLKAKAV